MISQKIRLYPNQEQIKYLRDRFHYSRYSYNEMLGQAKQIYENNKKAGLKTLFNINDLLNWKRDNKLDWEKEFSNQIIETTSENLDTAFNKFFKKQSKFPKFKTKKNNKMSFSIKEKSRNLKWQMVSIGNDKIRADKNHRIKMAETPKYNNPKRYTFSEVNGRFYVSICFDDNNIIEKQNQWQCGLDVGIKSNVILADNQGGVRHFDLPKEKLNKIEEQIKFYNRKISKKQKGSNQYNLTKAKLNTLWFKYNNQIDDFIHKLSNFIVSNYNHIGLETLNVKGMFKNRHLSHSLQRSSISKTIDFLIQKAEANGCEVVKIDKFYPSSQICSKCGKKHSEMKDLSKRTFKCECGLTLDRDENAALNILNESLKVESAIK